LDTKLAEELEMLHSRICIALGDPKRLLLLYTLASKSHNVTELAAELDMPQSTLSRHLTILRERSLVKAQREGTAVYYSLADARVIAALDLLRALLRDGILAQAQLADFAALEAQRTLSTDE
jgi:ArsR family transcriptional regulator